MLARTDSRARAVFLLIVAAIVAGLIGGRLIQWQVIEQPRLVELARSQLTQQAQIPAARGEIVDRNGTLLATSVELKSVFATPASMPEEAAAENAALLAPVLRMDADDLEQTLTSGAQWVWLARRVEPSVSARVAALDLDGIGMLTETQRVYPLEGAAADTTLGAQLLGFVNVDGQGSYGVEGTQDRLLAGLPGSITADEDVAGRQIADAVYELTPPVDGADLELTIDAGLQHLLEDAMWSTYRRNAARGVTGIVMDVRTGAVRAMASFPSFDANAYARTPTERFTNPAVFRQYEPGSVMKAFTIAAALDAGAITTRDKVRDDNNLRLRGVRIQNADRYTYPWGHGRISAGDVLKLSNNVGAARIGLKLGRTRLYEAFRRYGFGAPTGIEISGEASGVVWNPDGPNASGDLTAAQNAFGQGIGVTAIQMAAGYAAIANGGTLVTPHLVEGWTGPDGTFHPAEQQPGERVMREETARNVLRLLTDAVDDGIAQAASIPGYAIAGKTGTAEIAGPVKVRVRSGTDAHGKPTYRTETRMEYISGWIDSSFIGVMPATDPQLVTLIVIHRPAVWGLYQMAERPDAVFRELAPAVLDYLAIPPDRPGRAVAAR